MTVVQGDALALPLPDASVDLIVTSPPYFALRSYRDDGEHYAGQIGSEETPEAFLDALDRCMVEMGRVLKPSGSVFINLGDKYAAKPGQYGTHHANGLNLRIQDDGITPDFGGIQAKSLMGLPWRHAIRQIDAGWILRAELIWSKPNGLPESVTDRVRRSHEQWFHFTKEPRYFAAVDEIREPQKEPWRSTGQTEGQSLERQTRDAITGRIQLQRSGEVQREYNPLGRLPGSVWSVPTEPLKVPDHLNVDHFAAFPQEWPRKLILGWSPSGICMECGEGRRPVTVKKLVDVEMRPNRSRGRMDSNEPDSNMRGIHATVGTTEATITGDACACPTSDAPTRPAVVLDPFGGTGTVAGVARKLGRIGISLDLSMDYSRLADWRIHDSGHFDKTLKRTMSDRQGVLVLS